MTQVMTKILNFKNENELKETVQFGQQEDSGIKKERR